MQDTDNKASVEPTPPSPLSPVYTKWRSLFTAAALAPGAGLVASLMAVVVMLLLRVAAGIPTPVELFGDFVLKHINTGTFLQPPLSEDTWVFWAWKWTPIQRGTYTLTCRATDGTGEVQTSHIQGTVPNGGTGYYHKAIQIV